MKVGKTHIKNEKAQSPRHSAECYVLEESGERQNMFKS